MPNPVNEIHSIPIPVPANTPASAPVTVPCPIPALTVEWVEWLVPAGPRGNVGFWIGSHGQQIIPFGSGPANWIVTDDEKAHWDLIDQMDSGDWQVVAYNTGVRAHTLYVRFGLSIPPPPVVPVIRPIPSGILSGTVPGT